MSSSDPVSAAVNAAAIDDSSATGVDAPAPDMSFRIDFWVLFTNMSPTYHENGWFLWETKWVAEWNRIPESLEEFTTLAGIWSRSQTCIERHVLGRGGEYWPESCF